MQCLCFSLTFWWESSVSTMVWVRVRVLIRILANYFDTFFVLIFCYIYMTFFVQTTWWRSSEGRDQSTPKNVAAWRAPCAGTVSTFSSRLGCGTDWPPPCTTATGTATPWSTRIPVLARTRATKAGRWKRCTWWTSGSTTRWPVRWSWCLSWIWRMSLADIVRMTCTGSFSIKYGMWRFFSVAEPLSGAGYGTHHFGSPGYCYSKINKFYKQILNLIISLRKVPIYRD